MGSAHIRNAETGENSHSGNERNITPRNAVTSPEIAEDYNSSVTRVNEQSGSLNTSQNIAEKVADRNFENTGKIGDIDREISKNKSTVQASSDILRNEHKGAVRSQEIGRTEEDLKQTKPGFDEAETKIFEEKLKALRQK